MAEPQINSDIYGELFKVTPSPSQKRMIQIVEGAIKCYATIGIENTTYERIAKTCKITRPLIVHYFKDLDAIFDLAVKYIRANFQSLAINAIKKETDPKKQLTAYVESTFKWLENYPLHATTWKLVYYYCDIDPKLRELQTQMVNMGLERIEVLLNFGKSKNIFHCKDTQRAANNIQIVITGSLVKASTENLRVSLNEFAAQTAFSCLQIALGEPL